MAFGLEPDETVRESLTRAAREQVDRAVHELEERLDQDPIGAVHAARKAVKQERALLRLARSTLAAKQRVRANATLREAARRLSGARDAEVMMQTLDGLAERFAGQLPESTFDAFRARLQQERQSEGDRMLGSALTAAAVEDLRAVRRGIDDWELQRDGWRALQSGLLTTYRGGLKAFDRAREEPSLENLHEWRKSVKDLWYQLRLLAPVCGSVVSGQAHEAHRLADLLGDDHDLGVLAEHVLRLAPEVAVDHQALLGLVEHRREQLQAQATYVGDRLYAEGTKAFVRRIHRYWNAGRCEARTALSPPRAASVGAPAGSGA